MTNILTLFRHYLPNKEAGPVHSISGLAHHFEGDYKFKIITGPHEEVLENEWIKVDEARVLYCTSSMQSLMALQRVISSTPHDILYINSIFDPIFAIKPLLLRRMGMLPEVPVLVAPRGMFSSGALKIRAYKKESYLAAAKILNLFSNVIWQAASKQEKQDIRQKIGKEAVIKVVPNIPSEASFDQSTLAPLKKSEGRLRILFLSRITPKKNLRGALEMLKQVRGSVHFDIYGPIDDKGYWRKCRRCIAALPSNVEVTYHGPVAHAEVASTMSCYDLFLLPTYGENFGHVILEALAAGCPILISDQTPWTGLTAQQAGWDIPLSNQEAFVQVIERCLQMSSEEHMRWRRGAQRLSQRALDRQSIVDQHRKVFQSMLD